MRATIEFDVTLFRQQFPAFSNVTQFPDATLQMYWDMATCFISADQICGYFNNDCLILALNLMTAHLTALSVIVAGGQVPGLVQDATIDKVSVNLTPPPLKNQFNWWMSLTPYGQQLLAMLQAVSVGGMFIGGFPELSAFRRVYGVFSVPAFPQNGSCCDGDN